MAQVIFRTVDNSQIDVAKNRLMYKTGDVVAVVEDSHLWGEAESKKVWSDNGNDPNSWPGGFFILRIDGEPVTNLTYLLEQAGDTEEYTLPDPDGGDKIHTRYINNANRKRRSNLVDFDAIYNSLPPPLRKIMDANGEYTVTIAQFNQVVRVRG